MKKIIAFAATASVAAAMLAAPVSAYMIDLDQSTASFISDESTWKIITEASADSPFVGASKMQAVVYVDGDTEKYFRERSSGAYEDSDIEDEFSDFTGFLGLGARVSGPSVKNDWWLQFDYHGLSDSEGSETLAEVKKLDDVTYLLSADLSNITIDGAAGNPAIAVADWGNKSHAYWLAVKEAYLYGADGSVVLYSDGAGNMSATHDPFDISQYVSAAAETASEETASVETASEETATAETTTTTAAETTTTAKPEDTTAAVGNEPELTTSEETAPAATTSAPTTDKKSFGSRDSSLLISGIVAGVIIVAAVIALVVINLKKKK